MCIAYTHLFGFNTLSLIPCILELRKWTGWHPWNITCIKKGITPILDQELKAFIWVLLCIYKGMSPSSGKKKQQQQLEWNVWTVQRVCTGPAAGGWAVGQRVERCCHSGWRGVAPRSAGTRWTGHPPGRAQAGPRRWRRPSLWAGTQKAPLLLKISTDDLREEGDKRGNMLWIL